MKKKEVKKHKCSECEEAFVTAMQLRMHYGNKHGKAGEITVKVQSMFPNCQKYEPCCKESGYEETMKKVKKIHNFKEMIDDMLETAKEKKD